MLSARRWAVVATALAFALAPQLVSRRAAPQVVSPNVAPLLRPSLPLPEPPPAPPLLPLYMPPPPVLVTLASVNAPGEILSVPISRDGKVDAHSAAALAHFFRCRRSGRERPMDPGVLALIADIAAQWPGHVIEVVSGYRTRPWGVRHSRHFDGAAVDLRVRGIKLSAVRDEMWHEHRGIGVGYYPRQGWVHLDSRPPDEDAAWTARREGAVASHHPRWARR